MKGTILPGGVYLSQHPCFNPRTREGYDALASRKTTANILIPVPMKGTIDIGWQVLHRYTILIPVPVKGTTSFITREIINDMF